MHAALALNPRALISLIHTGYIVDASAIKYFSETSHISAIPEPINLKFVSILYEAGFLMEFNVLPQHSFTKKQGNSIPSQIIIALLVIFFKPRIQSSHADGA